MEFFIGSSEATDLYLGNFHIEEIWKGSDLLYSYTSQSESSPLPDPSNPDITVSKYISLDDGKEKTVYWTAGITPPSVGSNLTKAGGSDFNRLYIQASGDVTYDAPWSPGNGWYDVKKSDAETIDDNLCFLAVAVNSLWWWTDRNKENIESMIRYNSNDPVIKKLDELLRGSKEQLGSSIWTHYITKFGRRNKGYWPDPVQDNFLNGYKFLVDQGEYYANSENNEYGQDGEYLKQHGPDNIDNNPTKPMCGFFYNVLSTSKLSRRTPLNPENTENIDKIILDSILAGEQMGIVYFSRPNTYSTHIISIWGVEYDNDGTLSALFVCDNNDAPSPEGESMKRMMITKRDGLVYLTTKKDRTGGVSCTTITHLGQGKQEWDKWKGIN